MANTQRPLIVIPVYNHREGLSAVAIEALSYGDVLIVNDGSTDNVDLDIAALPVASIKHDVNKGKGAAILSAARFAQEQGYTHIITIDADGQHLASDLPKFFAEIEAAPQSVVVGVRDFSNAKKRNIPGSATFGRAFSNFWFRVQTGEKGFDTQSGFRAYPVMMLQELTFSESRYSFEIEVLVKAAWAGLSINWIPIDVHYPEPDKRVSHLHRIKDNVLLSWLNTRLTIRAMLPLPHRKLVRVENQTTDDSEQFYLTRPVDSLRDMVRQGASPEYVGYSAALGVLLGTWPLFGIHTVATLFAASFLRLSKVISVGTSQFCMPPLVPALCIEVGYYIRNGEWLTDVSWQTLGVEFLDRAWEWILGSLIVAPVLAAGTGIVFYILTRSIGRLRQEI
ncbi:DUF2062 domain-containing protein [Halodesulfovibrio spirochaetisodalis]|uniref:Glycosyl transferase family 2 n=1 Tax=Halodesulfovibrio spirochaetisodalis TaxID=1560234 RepID=A0A1B7XBG4_9BACT|nr:DUF2062 domain-containing protein [Halodesulfovibrio spirochaetisodalis]OBQ50109.1 glycosyl transferase family 2 [Halodesulfovibrio spirochaetisodalis]